MVAGSRVGVLHMTDTLDPGGMERVAVNLVNALPRERFEVGLCTTRRSGPLADLVAKDVLRLDLNRTRTLDPGAVRRLRTFIRTHQIRIIHAHATALFTAIAGSFCPPFPRIVWHDHCGHEMTRPRRVSLYRTAAMRIAGVIAVNEFLAEWARTRLRVRPDRVWYIPNFVAEQPESGAHTALPGRPGRRVACVANLRAQKNHLDLLRGFALTLRDIPDAHLLLIGGDVEAAYARTVHEAARELGLSGHVTFMGESRDVPGILRECDLGVLSSVSEGFPLALVEYGLAGLGVVTTDVGQCSEVVDAGRAGLLIPAGDPAALGSAIGRLLASPELRKTFGERLRARVQERYGAAAIIEQIGSVYDAVARRRPQPAGAVHARRPA